MLEDVLLLCDPVVEMVKLHCFIPCQQVIACVGVLTAYICTWLSWPGLMECHLQWKAYLIFICHHSSPPGWFIMRSLSISHAFSLLHGCQKDGLVLEQALVQFRSCGDLWHWPSTAAVQVVWEQQAVVCLPGWFPFQTPHSCGAWPEPDKVLLKIYFYHSYFHLALKSQWQHLKSRFMSVMDLAHSKLQFILWLFKFLTAAFIPSTLLHTEPVELSRE